MEIFDLIVWSVLLGVVIALVSLAFGGFTRGKFY
jgi:hypothetical protein